MISIVDYGVGNLGSVVNMLEHIDIPCRRVTDPDELADADRIILPGVGAFDAAVRELDAHGFREPLLERVRQPGVALLGICLGMQMLGRGSEEGELDGLGLVDGYSRRFPAEASDGSRLRVPHMGWAYVDMQQEHPVCQALGADIRFYFAHSYHMDVAEGSLIATAQYGDTYAAIVGSGNVIGCQFHPEKSHRFGMQLFRNFSRWSPQ